MRTRQGQVGNRTEYDVGVQDPSDTDYEANQLNQYLRAVTDDPNVAQGYRHDEDGNLIEAFVAADMNCDGAIDSFDVSPFILAMTNLYDKDGYYELYPTCNHLNGDLNGDGAVDSFDLDLFTALLIGSGGATGLRVEYTWNAENRLTAVTPVSPQVDDIKVELAYDYMGRRVRKQVYEWDGSEWDLTADTKFVWAGWLMLLELDALDQDAVVRKYTWGLDLAGQSGGQTSGLSALQSAGGIGGLLAVHDAAEEDDYVYLYDANGNVGQLVAWVSGFGGASGDEWHADRLVAHYEYDPYGNIVNQTGDYAEENPFRFSTKYFDNETGLGYWGERYYTPRTGRWLSRDPLGEGAGVALYVYAANDPLAVSDALGLLDTKLAGEDNTPDEGPVEVNLPAGIKNPCPTDMYPCKNTLNSFPPKGVFISWDDPVGSFLWVFKDAKSNQWQHQATGTISAAWERINGFSLVCLGVGDSDEITISRSETSTISSNWNISVGLSSKHWHLGGSKGGSTSTSITTDITRTLKLVCSDNCTQRRRFYYQLYYSGTLQHQKKRRWMWYWENAGRIPVKLYSGDLGFIECCKCVK